MMLKKFKYVFWNYLRNLIAFEVFLKFYMKLKQTLFPAILILLRYLPYSIEVYVIMVLSKDSIYVFLYFNTSD